jgi:hypothetical protein
MGLTHVMCSLPLGIQQDVASVDDIVIAIFTLSGMKRCPPVHMVWKTFLMKWKNSTKTHIVQIVTVTTKNTQ